MTPGQPEKSIAAIFSFGHRTATGLNVSNYLPALGGTSQVADMSFIVPQSGTLKNLYWDCDANSLAAGSTIEIHVGNVHATPSVTAASPAFPIAAPPANLVINAQGTKTTNTPPLPTDPCPNPLDHPVLAGQRIGVYLKRTGGTITKLRVSFELEVARQSSAWQLSNDNSTVYYDGGNVGIGTTVPNNVFQVAGLVNLDQHKLSTFIGEESGGFTNTGDENTAVGCYAYHSGTIGDYNTAMGCWSLENNTEGNWNTGNGAEALRYNINGNWNTAAGSKTLYLNTNGSYNVALGSKSLQDNRTGNNNTGNGYEALMNNKTGNNNTAVGNAAGGHVFTTSNNTFLGSNADVLGDFNNATAIGANAKAGQDNCLVLGDLSVNVGIGTSTPQQKLDLIGSIKISDGTEGDGKVLTSDANGKGRWLQPASLPAGISGQTLRHNGTAWEAGSNLYNDGTSIGLSTNAPAGKLHIKGTADASQLVVEANATQSNNNPLIKLRKPDGTDLMWIHSNNPTNIYIGTGAGTRGGTGYWMENYNTCVGANAGRSNVTGECNTAVGFNALCNNGSNNNTAIGIDTLSSNTGGYINTANGSRSLYSNISGFANTAIGVTSLYLNQTGNKNTAAGNGALQSNIAGNNNTALGYGADVLSDNLNNATAIGANAKVAGSNSLVLGGTGTDAVSVGIGTTTPTSKLQVVGLPVFPNNAAAKAGGLTTGAFYRTGADPDPVCVVHD